MRGAWPVSIQEVWKSERVWKNGRVWKSGQIRKNGRIKINSAQSKSGPWSGAAACDLMCGRREASVPHNRPARWSARTSSGNVGSSRTQFHRSAIGRHLEKPGFPAATLRIAHFCGQRQAKCRKKSRIYLHRVLGHPLKTVPTLLICCRAKASNPRSETCREPWRAASVTERPDSRRCL